MKPAQLGRVVELASEPAEHPDPLELAGWLERGSAGQDPAAMATHLAACRRCMALVTELMEVASGGGADVGEFGPVPERWLHDAHAIGSVARRPGGLRSRPRVLARGLAVALAVAAVLGLIERSRSNFDGGPDARSVQEAAQVATVSGLLLVPDPAPIEPERRRSSTRATPELAAAVDRLADDAERGEPAAYWASVGMLIEGDPRARAMVERARVRHPASRRLRQLSPLVAWRENRPGEAERELTVLVAENPADHLALYNLAAVRAERGDSTGFAAEHHYLDSLGRRGRELAQRLLTEFGPLVGDSRTIDPALPPPHP